MMPGRSKLFSTAFGSQQLIRVPETNDQSLRAWDAADEYLLEYLDEHGFVGKSAASMRDDTGQQSNSRLLLINDTFGALTCALTCASTCGTSNNCEVYHWSDSLLSQQAVIGNTQLNEHARLPGFIKSTDKLNGLFDLVLIRVPKTTALLEDQLHHLRPHLHANSVVIAAGMVRNLSRSMFRCFEKIIGSVTTSLARKKARLIFVTLDPALTPQTSPYPATFTDSDLGIRLFGHANVFSRERLDVGTRFFLKQFKQLPRVNSVIDLGCGNGVLGIAFQLLHESAKLCFVDESFMAVESARASYKNQFPELFCNTEFVVNDSLSGFPDNSVDLILCNPPFHHQHTVAQEVARRMFVDSKRCLSPGGELWLVANRHLRYRTALKRLFGRCTIAAAGPNFTVYRAV